jgi:hypothetical protein
MPGGVSLGGNTQLFFQKINRREINGSAVRRARAYRLLLLTFRFQVNEGITLLPH